MTTKTERSTGDWFQTYTGKAWWPMDPKPDDVYLEDIAHGLAYQCRFNGHCRGHYSIAEHSVRAAETMLASGPRAALAGLLHDAAEAYLGDIVRPIKRQLPRFYEIGRLNMAAIYEGLGVPFGVDDYADLIAETDLILLATERRDLMAPAPMSWVSVERVAPLPDTIVPKPSASAEEWFIMMFNTLRDEI